MSDCTHVQLQTLLYRLGPGNTLVVSHLRSLGDTLGELVRHVQTLTSGGVGPTNLDCVRDALPFSIDGDAVTAGDQAGHHEAAICHRGAGGRPPKRLPPRRPR